MTEPATGGMPPGYEVLATREPDRPERRATWWVIGAVVLLVAALIGGVTYAVAGLSGGGAQPEDALPAGAVAFAKVDLDPAAGQKIDAIRFLRKFPSLRDRLSEDADLRKVLFDAVADEAGWGDVDFAHDVAPWLGKRVGMGVYAPGALGRGQVPSFVVALQVGDAGQARAGLDRLIASADSSDKPGYTMTGGYALLATDRATAEAAADKAAHGSLAGDKDLTSDLGALGDGIASMWIDGTSLTNLVPSYLGLAAPGLLGLSGTAGTEGPGEGQGAGAPRSATAGRLAYTLRFDGPDVLELAGHLTGGPKLAGSHATVTGLGDLPASTVAALGIGGGDELVDSAWQQMRASVGSTPGAAGQFDRAVAAAEAQLGLDLPADVKALLGSNLLVALDGAGDGAGDGGIEVGAHATTSNAARANQVIGRLLAMAGQGEPDVVHRAVDGGYVVATSPGQADRMTTPAPERLGDADGFRTALPDIDGARFAAWVDIRSVVEALFGQGGFGQGSSEVDENLAPLAGFGITATSDDNGGGSFRARLVTR